MYTYNQETKRRVRHKALKYAISQLTNSSMELSCVSREYVRNIYDYFEEIADGKLEREIKKIDISYIREWEKLHDSQIKRKRVEDLTVCYLSGPEPQNDFKELVSLGIHPNNIWAFENDQSTYDCALKEYDSTVFPKPKIIKNSIEKFFMDTPKKFDIVYIDACSNVTSRKGGVRLFASLCKYHRLNSPGIVISNYSMPDYTHSDILESNLNIITPYFWSKTMNKFNVEEESFENYKELRKDIEENFEEYYSKYITRIMIDIASVIIPVQRFSNSEYIKSLIDVEKVDDKVTYKDLNNIKNDAVYKYITMSRIIDNKELNEFNKNLSGYGGYKKNLLLSYKLCREMYKSQLLKREKMKEDINFFENSTNFYQFLDKASSSLYMDVLINQLSYPLHYVTDKIRRYKYTAKTNKMFLDVIPFDECRYIYDWLPATEQIGDALKNLSWQYIFRFALDGLVKQRINYNNEFFFQGSVISKHEDEFKSKVIMKREEIY